MQTAANSAMLELEARRVRDSHRYPSPLIVGLTGWGKQGAELLSKQAGFDLHVVKPVEEQHLLQLVGGQA